MQLKELKKEITAYVPGEKLEEFTSRSSDGLFNVDSRDQLAALLFDVLGIGRGKTLKTTKSGRRTSTGKKELEKLKREHPVIPKCLLYAEISKLKNTYTDTLPRIARWDEATQTYRVHTTFMTTRTDTGRVASKNPNLQNISTRTATGREIRKGFIASPGMKLISADFAQQEMRILAHYSRDENLIRCFNEGLDVHTETARRIFRTETPDKLTQRDPSKNIGFGIIYGLSGPGLYDLMAVTYGTAGLPMPEYMDTDWCTNLIEEWFNSFPSVKVYLENQYYRARRYGIVWDMFGRTRTVPEVESVHEHIRSQGLRQAANMPIQSTGAGWLKIAMAEMYELLPWVGYLVPVHDEILAEAPEELAEDAAAAMSAVMCQVMDDRDSGESMLRVPITAGSRVTDRWTK